MKRAKVRLTTEEAFALQLQAERILFERELLFAAPARKWRMDFALPRYRVAIELDGGGGRMAHGNPQGMRAGARKANAAACLGWTVLRGTKDMVRSGELLATVLRLCAIKVGADIGIPKALLDGAELDLARARARREEKRIEKAIAAKYENQQKRA